MWPGLGGILVLFLFVSTDDSNRIVFGSLNCNGLKDVTRRRMLFRHFRNYRSFICCLQETHVPECLKPVIKCQWGGQVIVSGDSSTAGGLITLVSKDLDVNIEVIAVDRLTYYCIMRVTLNGKTFILVNVYIPVSNQERTQIQTLRNLIAVLDLYIGEDIILMGDWNVIFNPILERITDSPSGIFNPNFLREMESFLDAFALVDVWRDHNPEAKLFTFYSGRHASRLDYIFASNHLSHKVSDCGVREISISDHRFIYIVVGRENWRRGPGYWKLNPSLLDHPGVAEDVIDLIKAKKLEYVDLNPVLSWELLKLNIRELLVSWKKKINKDRLGLQKELLKQMKLLAEQGIVEGEEIEFLHSMRRELYTLDREFEVRAQVRSRTQWAMYGGKPSRYFLNLERHASGKKVIKQLVDENGSKVRNEKDILEMERDFFQTLYAKKVDSALPDAYSSRITEQIDDLDKAILEDPFTTEDLERALKSMANNKCPGSDGFPVEFYKRFWPSLGEWMLACFNTAFANGQLSPEQRRGLISLLPKKGKDKNYIKNWRPISLLNVDFKVLAKSISQRLFFLIPRLIHFNQSGFVPGRFIGVNLRNISDVISFLQDQEVDEGGLVVSLDFAKAFDTLDREFLFRVLSSYNFGDNLIKWIRLLYTGVESCVMNNGFSSGWFPLEAGLRQGCPLSPFLFILAVEKMADAISSNVNIRGISMGNCEINISQYADDSTIFVRDSGSLETMLDQVRDFGLVSGLHLNTDKCEGLLVKCTPLLGPLGSQISFSDRIHVLGLDFYASPPTEDSITSGYTKYVTKMSNICAVWQSRRLPIKGKVTVLNSLVLPIIYYIASNSYCPNTVISQVNAVVTNFLWNGNRSKISMKTLILPVREGGLGLHDFRLRLLHLKLCGLRGWFPLALTFGLSIFAPFVMLRRFWRFLSGRPFFLFQICPIFTSPSSLPGR